MIDTSINLHAGIPRLRVLYLYSGDVQTFHRAAREDGLVVPELESTFYRITELRLDNPDGNRLWLGQAQGGD